MLAFVHSHYVEILAALPALLLLAGVFVMAAIDPYIQKRHRRTLLILSALVFSLIAQNFAEYLLSERYPMVALRTLVATYGYCVRPVILLLFLYIVRPDRGHRAGWALVGANAAIYLVSLFTRVCFWISEDNLFKSGLPGFRYTCLFASMALLAVLLFQSVRSFWPSRRRETWIPIFVTLMILLAILLDENVGSVGQPVSFLTIFIVIGCTLYYNWLHTQFVRDHEEALEADQRIQIMLSQIKPHFLYNALGAIEEMCDSDPQKAKDTTVKFAKYLRGSMDSISAKGTIPFEKELNHTRLYLDMEQIRFDDALRVRYEIECMDFEVPTLTLEPLAENAVRHGIRGNEDGRGTVTIAAREFADHYEVSVTDDGPGFDPDHLPTELGHVGIENVRGRLTRICGGRLEIRSAPGEGTTAIMILPKEGNA